MTALTAKFPSFDGTNVINARSTLLQALLSRSRSIPLAALAAMLLNFEKRSASPQGPHPQEVAATYSLLSQLVSENSNAAILNWKLRWLAAVHFLSHVSEPQTVSAGSRLASSAVCLIHRAFILHPSRLAEMMYSLAIGARLVLPGRHVSVDFASLQPGRDELVYRPGLSHRSFAVKLLQLAVVNGCLPEWQTYRENNGRPGREYKGQAIIGPGGEALYNPVLTLEMLSRFNKLNFGDDETVFAHAKSLGESELESAANAGNVVIFSCLDEFADALDRAVRSRNLPITLAVDERKLLADSYCDGVTHAINVVQYSDFGAPQILNPRLLAGMQRQTKLPLHRLYNATFLNKSETTNNAIL